MAVSPQNNILVDNSGSARLIGFALSEFVEGVKYGYTYENVLRDAVRWVAPEVLDPEQFNMDRRRLTYASDIYAFALTAIEV